MTGICLSPRARKEPAVLRALDIIVFIEKDPNRLVLGRFRRSTDAYAAGREQTPKAGETDHTVDVASPKVPASRS
jgi:hypothetical protein